MPFRVPRFLCLAGLLLAVLYPAQCSAAKSGYHSTVVMVTAYNAEPGQTSGNPRVGAWGDKLTLDKRPIAVSRDLLSRGLSQGTRVVIQGYEQAFTVLDKMGPGITNSVDIYMGSQIKKARQFGRKRMRIWWHDP